MRIPLHKIYKASSSILCMKTSGLGVDIIEVQRFKNLAETSPFYEKVFSAEEMKYCQSKNNPAESLAGIFAAKEAVRKALNAETITFRDIIITHQKNGAPQCAVKNWPSSIAVSIAHSGGFAIAACIDEKR